MQPAVKAVVLLVLVCTAISSPDPVMGAGKRPRCTEQEKHNILHHCEEYTKRGHHAACPPKDGPCCKAVREVPGNDMQCIIDLLTAAERGSHEDDAIRSLEEACEDEGPCAHHQPPTYSQVNR